MTAPGLIDILHPFFTTYSTFYAPFHYLFDISHTAFPFLVPGQGGRSDLSLRSDLQYLLLNAMATSERMAEANSPLPARKSEIKNRRFGQP